MLGKRMCNRVWTPRLGVVCGWAGRSAGAEGRATRKWARSKMRSWSERWRNMAKGFAAHRTTLGAHNVGTQPTAPLFTFWIDTLNCGARH